MPMSRDQMTERLKELDQQIKEVRWWGAYLGELYEERKALLSALGCEKCATSSMS